MTPVEFYPPYSLGLIHCFGCRVFSPVCYAVSDLCHTGFNIRWLPHDCWRQGKAAYFFSDDCALYISGLLIFGYHIFEPDWDKRLLIFVWLRWRGGVNRNCGIVIIISKSRSRVAQPGKDLQILPIVLVLHDSSPCVRVVDLGRPSLLAGLPWAINARGKILYNLFYAPGATKKPRSFFLSELPWSA